VDLLNLILGMWLLASFALQARNWHSWGVLLIGVFIACMGAWGAYEFTSQAEPSSLPAYFGQVLLGFSSVVGGALVGSSFSELRQESGK